MDPSKPNDNGVEPPSRPLCPVTPASWRVAPRSLNGSTGQHRRIGFDHRGAPVQRFPRQSSARFGSGALHASYDCASTKAPDLPARRPFIFAAATAIIAPDPFRPRLNGITFPGLASDRAPICMTREEQTAPLPTGRHAQKARCLGGIGVISGVTRAVAYRDTSAHPVDQRDICVVRRWGKRQVFSSAQNGSMRAVINESVQYPLSVIRALMARGYGFCKQRFPRHRLGRMGSATGRV